MRLLTFLAGAAAAVLVTQYAARGRNSQAFGAAAEADRGEAGTGSTGGERDYPTHSPPETDDQLRDRICTRLARTVHNPEAIEVDVRGGRVILRGQVDPRDAVLLMAEVENTTGVQSVQNELQVRGSQAQPATQG